MERRFDLLNQLMKIKKFGGFVKRLWVLPHLFLESLKPGKVGKMLQCRPKKWDRICANSENFWNNINTKQHCTDIWVMDASIPELILICLLPKASKNFDHL